MLPPIFFQCPTYAFLFAGKEFGDKIETTYVENVSEGPDAERAIERLARSGYNAIFTTSFGYMNPTIKVAKKYPNVMFEHATGYKRSANVSTYSSRFYEGRYIIGQIAAKTSKTGTAGYIGSFAIPEVVRGINSFLLGAQSVNPDFKLKVVWVNSWFDPGKEADAAKALIDQGVDIISQHTDSPAPLQVAEERGIKGFGQASDMIAFAPKAQLTSIVDDWNSYYIARVKAVIDGTWSSTDTWGGLDADMVKMAEYTNLPDDVASAAAATEASIRDGSFHPFTGPIYKQDGTLLVGEGKVVDDKTLLGMNFYIKGVDGVIDNRSFRIFSEPVPANETERQRRMRRFYGGEVDGISRQLARYVHKNVKTYMPEMNPMMIYRLDRFGRGGHHRPFNDLGFAGIRIMEAHENYTQQHQDIRTENGINYGDTFEHVNFPYSKKLTAVNAINLASLAWAPEAPKEVAIGGIVKPSAKLKWNKVEGAKGYKIYWRDTTSPTWDNSRYVETNEFTLEGIVIDNFFFGVAAVGKNGHESVVVFPNKIWR